MSLAGVIRSTRNAEPSKPITGLRGIVLAVSGNLSVKVTDYRSRGIADVKITTNTGKSFFTDAQGNAFILVEGTGVILTLTKYGLKRKHNLANGVAQVELKFAKPVMR